MTLNKIFQANFNFSTKIKSFVRVAGVCRDFGIKRTWTRNKKRTLIRVGEVFWGWETQKESSLTCPQWPIDFVNLSKFDTNPTKEWKTLWTSLFSYFILCLFYFSTSSILALSHLINFIGRRKTFSSAEISPRLAADPMKRFLLSGSKKSSWKRAIWNLTQSYQNFDFLQINSIKSRFTSLKFDFTFNPNFPFQSKFHPSCSICVNITVSNLIKQDVRQIRQKYSTIFDL